MTAIILEEAQGRVNFGKRRVAEVLILAANPSEVPLQLLSALTVDLKRDDEKSRVRDPQDRCGGVSKIKSRILKTFGDQEGVAEKARAIWELQ